MASSSLSAVSPGADLLEFCLKSWPDLDQNGLTEVHITHAVKIAALLTSAERFQAFDKFVGSIHDDVLNVFMKNEHFRRALIQLRCHQERHEEVCQLIKDGTFSEGADLVDVWDAAHYALREQQYGKPLSSLTRFRVRKRNPPPLSICKHGRSTRNLDSGAKCVLWEWLKEHHACPYPDRAQRDQLRQRTGLTNTQIRTWFANARRRRREERERKLEKKRREEGTRSSKARQRQCSKKSSSARPKPPRVQAVPTSGSEGHRRRQADRLLQTAAPPSASTTQYHQPGASPISEGTGLQGLVCMYNRLPAAQRPATSPPHFQPLLHNPHPPSSSRGRGFLPNSQHITAHTRLPQQNKTAAGPVLIQTRHQPDLGGGEGWVNRGSIQSPVLVTPPPWTATVSPDLSLPAHTWDTLRPPPVVWQQVDPTLILGQECSGQLHGSAETGIMTGRKCAVTTATLTAMPAPVFGQRQVMNIRMVSATPVEHQQKTVTPAPVVIGVKVPEVQGATMGDQYLAMWNSASWRTAHSSHLSTLHSVDSISDLLQSDLHHCQPETDILSPVFATDGGDVLLPEALPDALVALQSAPTITITGSTQPFSESIFSPQSLVLSGTEEVEEAAAAHILLDLAATPKP